MHAPESHVLNYSKKQKPRKRRCEPKKIKKVSVLKYIDQKKPKKQQQPHIFLIMIHRSSQLHKWLTLFNHNLS